MKRYYAVHKKSVYDVVDKVVCFQSKFERDLYVNMVSSSGGAAATITSRELHLFTGVPLVDW